MVTITEFQERVYLHLLLIPSGQVTTYAALARVLGSSPRAVGGALRCNPFAPAVPCHRVIASDGSLGGFMGEWKRKTSTSTSTTTSTSTSTSTTTTTTPTLGINQSLKLKLLKDEGIEFVQDRHGQWRVKMLVKSKTTVTSRKLASSKVVKTKLRSRSRPITTSSGRSAVTQPTTTLASDGITESKLIKSKYFHSSSSDHHESNQIYFANDTAWPPSPKSTAHAKAELQRIIMASST